MPSMGVQSVCHNELEYLLSHRIQSPPNLFARLVTCYSNEFHQSVDAVVRYMLGTDSIDHSLEQDGSNLMILVSILDDPPLLV